MTSPIQSIDVPYVQRSPGSWSRGVRIESRNGVADGCRIRARARTAYRLSNMSYASPDVWSISMRGVMSRTGGARLRAAVLVDTGEDLELADLGQILACGSIQVDESFLHALQRRGGREGLRRRVQSDHGIGGPVSCGMQIRRGVPIGHAGDHERGARGRRGVDDGVEVLCAHTITMPWVGCSRAFEATRHGRHPVP